MIDHIRHRETRAAHSAAPGVAPTKSGSSSSKSFAAQFSSALTGASHLHKSSTISHVVSRFAGTVSARNPDAAHTGRGSGTAADPKSLVAIPMDQPATAAPVTQSTPAASDDPVAALQQAIKDAGMDPSAFKMDVHNDTVSYMAGSYQDRQLVVQFPNGKTASYSADLVAKNASVAVNA